MLGLRFSLVASAFAFVAVVGDVSSAGAADVLYEKVGRWSVMALPDAAGAFSCAAGLSNGRMTLRLVTDGKKWQVGYPARGKVRTIETYFGFEVAGEVGNFRVNGAGWALMDIDGDQVEAFRTIPSFLLTFDSGEQTWTLTGAAGALNKVRECVRNSGRKASWLASHGQAG